MKQGFGEGSDPFAPVTKQWPSLFIERQARRLSYATDDPPQIISYCMDSDQDPYISLSKFSGFAICWRAAVSKTSHRTRASKDSLEFIDYARPSTRCGWSRTRQRPSGGEMPLRRAGDSIEIVR